MRSMSKDKTFWLSLLAFLTILCTVFATALLPATSASAESETYKYGLAFEDDFDDGLNQNWYVYGGSYVSDGTQSTSVKKWRFYGENHIIYKRDSAPYDYGKFLYGKKANTNYMFEVKVRADVNEIAKDFDIANGVLTLDTYIPFFVTNTTGASSSLSYQFYGRSVRINNWGIGFYEYGEGGSGWANNGAAWQKIKNIMSADFDWRDWHTVRVEATETECSLWLDDESVMTVENSAWSYATTAAGYCGFAGNAAVGYSTLHFDDFKYWTNNTTYDMDSYEPAATITDRTVTVKTPANGSVTVNGTAASATQTVNAHSEVELAFTPANGYVVDSVKINGTKMGRISEFTISNITQDYEVEVAFTAANNVDVYILAGQSNAAGFTPAKGLYKAYTYGGTVDQEKLAEYENGYADVMYYGITKTADPANAGANWTYVRVGQGSIPTMIGPELGFAETMSAYYDGSDGRAALVKYAVGSTGFVKSGAVVNTYGNWYSPTAAAKMKAAGETLHEKTGLLYENLLLTVRQAISGLLEQGYEPNVKGIFWMQGCEDAKDEELAAAYQEHLTDLINDLRSDLTSLMTDLSHAQDCSQTPFVIGKIGADLSKADYEGIVREEMQKAAAALSNVRIVETDDFVLPDENDNNDSWHFATKDVLTLGNRFADVLAQMTGKKTATTYQVSFDLNGGEGTCSPQTVEEWMTASEPAAPDRTGYTFVGWYEGDSDEAWDFTANGIKTNVLLTAKWEEKAADEQDPDDENTDTSGGSDDTQDTEQDTDTSGGTDNTQDTGGTDNTETPPTTTQTINNYNCNATGGFGGVTLAIGAGVAGLLKKRKRK